MKDLKKVAYYLAMIGALNWGLVELLNFNLVSVVLGSWSGLVSLVYILIGVSGAWLLLNEAKK